MPSPSFTKSMKKTIIALMSLAGIAMGGMLILTHAIPEPTTATLSLLALATLAARRRRR